jgi:hypothetical protein
MIELSNKCQKCGKLIKYGVASYSFNAFGVELCFDHQNLARLELKSRIAGSKAGLVDKKLDETSSEPIIAKSEMRAGVKAD